MACSEPNQSTPLSSISADCWRLTTDQTRLSLIMESGFDVVNGSEENSAVMAFMYIQCLDLSVQISLCITCVVGITQHVMDKVLEESGMLLASGAMLFLRLSDLHSFIHCGGMYTLTLLFLYPLTMN